MTVPLTSLSSTPHLLLRPFLQTGGRVSLIELITQCSCLDKSKRHFIYRIHPSPNSPWKILLTSRPLLRSSSHSLDLENSPSLVILSSSALNWSFPTCPDEVLTAAKSMGSRPGSHMPGVISGCSRLQQTVSGCSPTQTSFPQAQALFRSLHAASLALDQQRIASLVQSGLRHGLPTISTMYSSRAS